MKKQLVIIGITILLICVGLSGCLDEKSKFIGTWVCDKVLYNYTITFTSDDGYESQGHIWDVGEYEVKDGKLILHMSNSNMVFIFDYEFSNDDETFTLLYESGGSLLFTKQ